MQKIEKIMPYILLIAGVVLIFFGFKGISDRSKFLPMTGEITEITFTYDAVGTSDTATDSTAHVMVKYEIDGKVYEKELGEYSSSMTAGTSIDLMYNPEDVTDIITASYTSVIVMFALGTVSLIGGIMLLLKKRKAENKLDNVVPSWTEEK